MPTQKVIVFKLKNDYYGVPVEQVESIERWEQVTRVPNAPAFIKGIINMRGEILPVIDLQQRFGMGESVKGDDSRLVVAKNEGLKVGLIVDEARDVIDLDDSQIEPAPETSKASHSTYIYGVSKQDDHLLILLNMEKILRHDQMDEIQQIEV